MVAALSRTSPATSELYSIRELVAQNITKDGFHLPEDRARTLLRRLEVISRTVTNLERQLAVYRINEEDHATAGILDDLVGEFLSEEASKLEAPIDNLVFPEFGQKGGE